MTPFRGNFWVDLSVSGLNSGKLVMDVWIFVSSSLATFGRRRKPIRRIKVNKKEKGKCWKRLNAGEEEIANSWIIKLRWIDDPIDSM